MRLICECILTNVRAPSIHNIMNRIPRAKITLGTRKTNKICMIFKRLTSRTRTSRPLFKNVSKNELLEGTKSAITWITLLVPVLEGTRHKFLLRGSRLTVYRLSAIMLGRLEMSVQSALDQYDVMGDRVFGKPRFALTKYSSSKTEEAFRIVVENGMQGEFHGIETQPEKVPFNHDQRRCRT